MNQLNIGKIAQFITEDPDSFNSDKRKDKEIEDLFTDRNSFLGDDAYYGVLGIVQQELAKYGCKLDRHRKRSHTTGMDIDITVKCTKNPKEMQMLRDKLEESMPYKKWDFDNKKSAYALAAINPDIDKRITDEYGFDYVAHQWSDSDIVTITVSKPRPDFKPEEEDDFEAGEPEMGEEEFDLGPEEDLGATEEDLELSNPDLESEGEENTKEGAEDLTDEELLGVRSEAEKAEKRSKGLEY